MATQDKAVETLEQGNIYFFYRPRVERHDPSGIDDVQNLYMVLAPYAEPTFRLAIIGRERLPEPTASGRERMWGFVDSVHSDVESLLDELKEDVYQTRTRGERHRPAARPAGEGVYRLVRHGDHTHLAYALDLPERPGPVQEELHIAEEASYILTVRNPDAPSPPSAGLPRRDRPEYPDDLQARFRGRKFSPVDPPDFLDYDGAEFILIASSEDVRGELGLELEPDEEGASDAELLRELERERSQHPLEPLFGGEWA